MYPRKPHHFRFANDQRSTNALGSRLGISKAIAEDLEDGDGLLQLGDLGDLFFLLVREGRGLPSRKLTYPPKNGILKMIFLFPRWDMLIPWRVFFTGW